MLSSISRLQFHIYGVEVLDLWLVVTKYIYCYSGQCCFENIQIHTRGRICARGEIGYLYNHIIYSDILHNSTNTNRIHCTKPSPTPYTRGIQHQHQPSRSTGIPGKRSEGSSTPRHGTRGGAPGGHGGAGTSPSQVTSQTPAYMHAVRDACIYISSILILVLV
jgi:hypothetical protein